LSAQSKNFLEMPIKYADSAKVKQKIIISMKILKKIHLSIEQSVAYICI